jgi:poly(beta-D-mannuronate) lyase
VAYQAATVKAAQEALTRLGYDVGTPDGAWGPKSRAAMNQLRAQHGLPPADDFVGSSLWLVHRESPGETTLPHPGLLITDLVARKAAIAAEPPLGFSCAIPVGIGIRPDWAPTPDTVYPIDSPKGFIEGKDDWYSEINEGLTEAQGKCIAGKAEFCTATITMAKTWAEADALKPGARRNTRGETDVYWISNILLRNLVFAYDVAQTFETVDPATHALILDWLKRRIDDYHYIQRSEGKPGDVMYWPASNHALTRMMPAAIFGALVGDRSMMEPAFERWRIVLSSMRKDGSLPTETRRGARWFHYSSLQIGQLLTVQQLAKAQGIELVPTDPEDSIPHALSFVVAALGDFSIATKYAKANQGGGESNDYSIPFMRKFHFGFLPAYLTLYGEDENIGAMKSGTIDGAICSKASLSDDKIKHCPPADADGTFSLARVVTRLGVEPDQNMGYPAGCFIGTSVQHPLSD